MLVLGQDHQLVDFPAGDGLSIADVQLGLHTVGVVDADRARGTAVRQQEQEPNGLGSTIRGSGRTHELLVAAVSRAESLYADHRTGAVAGRSGPSWH